MNANNLIDEKRRPELTIRGLIVGVIITLVFTAANVYFGLKAGLTFSTSIPAAVISMAILRSFKNATVQENNIVQTVASAAGTLSSIIFVLPGLIMIGWWTGFPFWISFLICALGGILGVMYSIPLRRALVTNSDLPYPEGVACAEVLKIGSGGKEDAGEIEHSRSGLLAVVWGSIVAAVFAVIVATQVFAADVAQTFRIGRGGAVSGYNFTLSFALLAIGHLVGLSVGIAMLIGALIGWGWLVPYYSCADRRPDDCCRRPRSGDLESQSAVHRRGCDWRLRDLDIAEAGQTCHERSGRRDGRVARAQGRQSGYAADHRTRHSDRHRRHYHFGLHAADRLGARLLRQHERPRRAPANARHRRRGLRLPDELLRLGGLRLHGGVDRFVEQSAFGHRYSGRDRRRATPCLWREAVRRAGCVQGADGLRAFHHRGRLQRRRDREQQPAGP